MNEMQIFNHPEFGTIRTADVNGKPYAVGVDVARALEYSNPSKAVIDHCKGITKLGIPSYNQHGAEVIQETNVIPEGDIYRLIVKAADQSRNATIKEKAERYERWIFDEILPTIRKTGSYTTGQPANDKLIRARAMLLNAQTRQYEAIMKTIGDKTRLAPIAVEVFGLKALERVTGTDVGSYLPEVEKTYSATEVGRMLGVSSNMIGKVANANNIKTGDNGMWVMDKSRYSSKEVESFRYNGQGVERLRQLLNAADE